MGGGLVPVDLTARPAADLLQLPITKTDAAFKRPRSASAPIPVGDRRPEWPCDAAYFVDQPVKNV
jgi:hypothetical protein